MSARKIAYVVTPLVPRGGAFDILMNWLRTIDRAQFEVHLLYFSHKQFEEQAASIFRSMPWVKTQFLSSMRYRSALFVPTVVEVARYLRRERIDIVHTMFIQSDIIGAAAAGIAGVPKVYSSVVGKLIIPRGYDTLKRLFYRFAYTVVARRITRVVAISDETRREILDEYGHSPDQVQTIYCGIDLDRFKGRNHQARESAVVGTAAELIEEKGVRDFVDAARLILDQQPGTRFLIAGDGPERVGISEQIARAGLSDAISLLGWVTDIPEFLRGLDVFVFPSRPMYDGLPRVCLEAWAAGVPLVATSVAGVTETVNDGIDTLLVEPRDPAGIAAAVLAIINHPARADQLRDAGFKAVQRFSKEQEMAELQGLYAAAS
jgi:glycosyltransferase involved in cell wall biosynthesis